MSEGAEEAGKMGSGCCKVDVLNFLSSFVSLNQHRLVTNLIPFMSSMIASVVPSADNTAAVQQISPMQEGK